ncbi:hypothetical protein U1E44_03465 [Arenibacter sp. GZD96]|uniref:hypothetical protein n=1 Tax=Aurantibrevibacter litoralis TaxID=3106030 RepID=UPI002AFFF1B9|nr:hypothetical protein [Arenibacter sp. GZD-96]MEA1785137.1 hypothetical protein [Arenibacter sp. GZD-96]
MKQLVRIFILAMVLASCKGTNKNAQVASARVIYLSSEARNTVTLRSMDFGNNEVEAIYNAKKLSFQNIFFRGVASSPFNDPLIGIDEQAAYKTHKEYLTDFYENRMESFIIRSNESVEKVKGGSRQANVTLTINLRALRKDLEDKKVIRKFGL